MTVPDPQKTFDLIQKIVGEDGSECWWVGGSLRDLFLGRPTRDFDFALPGNPKPLAQKFAEAFQGALFCLEEEREIFRVSVPDGTQFDFARFKGAGIREDLERRDFTVNALALRLPFSASLKETARAKAGLLDPLGGLKDLGLKTIRQISPDIYEDDPLRLLRAFRVSAQLGFAIEPQTLEAVRQNAAKISRPAAERIREELLLLLDCPDAHETVLALDRAGLISVLFPEVDPNRTCAEDYYPGKGVWGHSLDGLKNLEWILKNLAAEFPEDHEKIAGFVFGRGDDSENHPRSTLMKLAILFHDIGKAPTAKLKDGRLRFFLHEEVGANLTRDIARRLRFSSGACSGIARLVQAHMRPGSLAHAPLLTEKAQFRFFRDLGPAALPMLLVSLADRYTYLTEPERGQKKDLHERVTKAMIRWHYQKELEDLPRKPKLLDGHDLMRELGLTPGKPLGELLRDIEEAQVLGEIRTREEALDWARTRLKKGRETS